jgi:hypothetical protein
MRTPQLLQAIFLSVIVLGTQIAHADGFVFQLPRDGTRATFTGTAAVTVNMELAPSVDVNTLTPEARKQLQSSTSQEEVELSIASVGEETLAQKKCRWIQISRDSNVLELLVSERCCHRGHDPLAGSMRTFFNWKEVDQRAGKIHSPSGFDRIRYEIERWRPLFPAPLAGSRQLPRETISTPVGEFDDCEVIAGESAFEGPLLGDAFWEVNSDVTIWLHEKAPFGVVKIAYDSTSREINELSTNKVDLQASLVLQSITKDSKRQLADQDQRDKE